MLENLNFKLNNFGVIDQANIELGKINVIAGHNSSGKSTSSKILYCFLRSNAKSRKVLSEKTLVKRVYELSFEFFSLIRPGLNGDSEDINKVLERIKEIIDEFNKKMENDEPPEKFNIISNFNLLKEIYAELDIKEGYKKLLDSSFDSVEELVKIFNEDGDELFKSLMNMLIKEEFGKNIRGLNEVSLCGKYNNNNFSYTFNVKDETEPIVNGWFILEDVLYLDSFSLFDLISSSGSKNTEHVRHVLQCISEDESKEWGDEIQFKKIIEISEVIKEITGGEFIYDEKNIVFVPNEDEKYLMKNTASGIKQIGVIQILLNNRKLKENSFLIIDEPEVNLHPRWQLEYAKILTLLAKELNITLYINSHNPLFIESIRTYAEKYDLLDDTNFYLTKMVSDKGSLFEKISHDDLYIIYDELGKPYDFLDEIQIKNMFKDRIKIDFSKDED